MAGMLRLRRHLSRTALEDKGPRGQIATFIIILMVVVMVLSMFITNMGQLSATTITVANAVDASALALASQLATTANTICSQLSDPEGVCSAGNDGIQRCRRTGLLAVFLAVIVVVAVAIITAGIGTVAAPAILAAWGAGAGAVGGAIAQRSWSGVAMGAAAGAAIGFGLGAGFSVGISGVGSVGTGGLSPALTASGTLATSTTAIVSGISAAALGALGAGYTQARMDHSARVDIDALSQSLTGLPEYERIREGVLLQALSLAVDDPNMTVGPAGGSGCYFPGQYGLASGDPFDVDGDGDTLESISCLNYWWSVRVDQLRQAFASRADLVRRYIEGPWNGEPTAGTLRDRRDKARGILQYLERSDVECQCQPLGPVPSEGATVEYFRRVDQGGFSYPAIFQPGPDQATLRAFLDDPTDTAPTPAGWDSLDAVQYHYKDFLAWADSIVYNPLLQGQCGMAGTPGDWYNRLAQTTDSWVPMLYNPASTEDYYDQLQFIMGEMGGWFLTGREIARNSPPCHLAYGDYPPVFSTQQIDPPFCDNSILVNDPNACPQVQDEDPIDNCTNVNNSTPANLVTGAHLANMDFDPDFSGTFPGPFCRIDLTHKTELVRQMDIVEPFVQIPTFQNFIQANYATHFDSPLPSCGPPPVGPPPPPVCTVAGNSCGSDAECCSNSCNICSGGRDGDSCSADSDCCSDDCNTCSATPVGGACAVDGDCCSNFCDTGLGTCGGSDPSGSCNGDGPSDSCNGPDPAAPVWQVRLVTAPIDMTVVSIDEVALEKWPAGSPDRLDYVYTFQFECENCVFYNGVQTCDPTSRYWWTEQRAKFYPDDGSPLDTPDLKVVRQTTSGGQTGQERFIAALAQIRLILTTLRANLDDFRHVYATTDADPGGIFNPAIGGGAEGADAAGGIPFIQHSEPYLFDPGIGAWTGTAALEYFLLQVVDFVTQLQNILGVQPAVDGRLPNPLQLINDPIRGGGPRVIDGFYEWQDSQGIHSVNVEIGPFIKPSTRNYKTGNWLMGKQCVEMLNYCDNTPGCRHHMADGTPFIGPDRTWIRITRRDPSNKQIGLWNWNPFAGTVRKTARASYNRLRVGICGTSGGDCP